MKKIIKYLFIISCAFMCIVVLPIHAATASGEDDNVQYTYWDQGEINTYWSGVYNKVSYNTYRPCVGGEVIGEGCGIIANQSQYREYCKGTSFFAHYHYLLSKYGTKDYYVK